jgi:hypothetical protein
VLETVERSTTVDGSPAPTILMPTLDVLSWLLAASVYSPEATEILSPLPSVVSDKAQDNDKQGFPCVPTCVLPAALLSTYHVAPTTGVQFNCTFTNHTTNAVRKTSLIMFSAHSPKLSEPNSLNLSNKMLSQLLTKIKFYQ